MKQFIVALLAVFAFSGALYAGEKTEDKAKPETMTKPDKEEKTEAKAKGEAAKPNFDHETSYAYA